MASATATPVSDLERGAARDGGTAHPHYIAFYPVWTKLRHVYDGTGGFLDGTYLVAHPREWEDHSVAELAEDGKTVLRYTPNPNPVKPTRKLKTRRSLARYENIAGPIIEQKIAALFRQPITRLLYASADDQTRERQAPGHPYSQWVENCDGYGTHLDDFMVEANRVAQIFGHSFVVMDRPVGPVPTSMAEQRLPVLRLYAPLDAPDWLLDENGQLQAIALLEAIPRASLDEPTETLNFRRRILTAQTWQVVTRGQPSEAMPHDFGRLPVVPLYAKRRGLVPLLGQSVLYDPQLYIDVYNITSELRELLRNQTFGILNVPLGTGETAQGVDDAKRMMGASTGTDNVLFTATQAAYIQPDSSNVTVYQQERADLLRTIYRLTNTPYESDSKDAEAEGSLQLKREDFNQLEAALADECERAEYALAELFFRAHFGPRWEAELEAADLSIQYPQTFDPTPFDELLEQAQAMTALGMPHPVMQAVMKQIVPQALPGATHAQITELHKAIEQMEDPAIQRQKEQEALIRARFGEEESDPDGGSETA